MLERYKVVTTEDGKQALEIIQESSITIDLESLLEERRNLQVELDSIQQRIAELDTKLAMFRDKT